MFIKKNHAAKKIDSIRSELASCLKNYKITNSPTEDKPARYEFKEIRKDKNQSQELELYSEKSLVMDNYKVKLKIKGFNQ